MAEKLHLSLIFCCFIAQCCSGEASCQAGGVVTVMPEQERLTVCNNVAIQLISVCTSAGGVTFLADTMEHQHVAFVHGSSHGGTWQQFMVYVFNITRLEVRLLNCPIKTYLITTSVEGQQQVMDNVKENSSVKRHDNMTSFRTPSRPHISIRSDLIQVDMYVCGAPPTDTTLQVTASFQNSSSGGGGVFEECRSTTPSVLHQTNSTSCERFSFCIHKMGVQENNLTNITFVMTAHLRGVHLSELDQSFTFDTGDCPVPNEEGPGSTGQPRDVLTSPNTDGDVNRGTQEHGRTVTLCYITLLAIFLIL